MYIKLGHLRWALDKHSGLSDDEQIHVSLCGTSPDRMISLMLVTTGDTLSIYDSQFSEEPSYTIKGPPEKVIRPPGTERVAQPRGRPRGKAGR